MKNANFALHCTPITYHSLFPHVVQHSDVGRLAPRPAMSPKQKKKAARTTNTSSDSSSVTSPVIATTNYREIHLNEVEALRSIYGDDFEDVENRRSAWKVGVLSQSRPDSRD